MKRAGQAEWKERFMNLVQAITARVWPGGFKPVICARGG